MEDDHALEVERGMVHLALGAWSLHIPGSF